MALAPERLDGGQAGGARPDDEDVGLAGVMGGHPVLRGVDVTTDLRRAARAQVDLDRGAVGTSHVHAGTVRPPRQLLFY